MTEKDKPTGAESFDIEATDVVKAPTLENYEPEDGLPYIPTITKPKFVDVSKPATYAQNNGKTNLQEAMRQQSQIPTEPDYKAASQNNNKVRALMGMTEKISGSAQAESAGGKQQGFTFNLQKLETAIKTLEGIEYWVPPERADVQKLRRIAQPIINALKAYVKNLR